MASAEMQDYSGDTMLDEEQPIPLQTRLAAGVFQRIGQSPYVLLALAPLFWSGNFVLGRAIAGDVPPIGLAFWRWLVGAIILASVARPAVRRDWPTIWQQLEGALSVSPT
jgi:hypothetical protein